MNQAQDKQLDYLFDIMEELYVTLTFIHDNPRECHEVIYSDRAADCMDELDRILNDRKNNFNLLEVH